ncbi:MAG: hypothetical protein ABIY48_10490 [Acidimicrobiales bacterium]
MSTHEHQVRLVADEQDDVLATLQLVRGDDALETRLFGQLVDLLVEAMFLELRQSFANGDLEREDYLSQLGTLAQTCRDAGLLPLPGRGL